MRPHGWQVGSLHRLALAQITLSSVKLCPLLHWFCALWNEFLLQSLNVLLCLEMFVFYQTKPSVFIIVT